MRVSKEELNRGGKDAADLGDGAPAFTAPDVKGILHGAHLGPGPGLLVDHALAGHRRKPAVVGLGGQCRRITKAGQQGLQFGFPAFSPVASAWISAKFRMISLSPDMLGCGPINKRWNGT